MKLYTTTTSPFARKVRVVAIEAGIDDRITLVQTTVRDPESTLLAVSPPCKVPVLRTDDGVVLSEAAYICAYLDATYDDVHLFPQGKERWTALQHECLACGLLEGTVTWVRALRAPAVIRNAKAINLEENRVYRCLDAFDVLAGIWNDGERPFLLPQITLGCALGALSFRMPEFDWRAGRPRLAQWWRGVSARPSMRCTVPFE